MKPDLGCGDESPPDPGVACPTTFVPAAAVAITVVLVGVDVLVDKFIVDVVGGVPSP